MPHIIFVGTVVLHAVNNLEYSVGFSTLETGKKAQKRRLGDFLYGWCMPGFSPDTKKNGSSGFLAIKVKFNTCRCISN
jgi:hypothetical protein